MGQNNAQLVVMGRVAAPYGVKGWVKIQVFTQTLDSLLDYPDWQIGSSAGNGGQWREVALDGASTHGGTIIAKFVGCNDRDAAFALRGQEIAVRRKELPTPEEGEYYWEDLIGLTVVNRDHVELGKVVKLMETGAHDVLVIQGGEAQDAGVQNSRAQDTEPRKEILIPFVGVFVLNVDLAQGRIEVDWGLDY